MSFLEIDFFQFHARILKEAELPQLTELCIACTDFFQLVEQQPGSEKTAREILQERPSNLPISHKIVWGFEKDFKLVGVVEILRDYPHSGVWYVGLLLLSPELGGNGYGKKLWEAIEQQIEKMGASEVKLIVQEQNPKARKFWNAWASHSRLKSSRFYHLGKIGFHVCTSCYLNQQQPKCNWGNHSHFICWRSCSKTHHYVAT